MEKLIAHSLEDQPRTADVDIKSMTPFSEMQLTPAVQRGLQKSGFVYPTVLQASAISMGTIGFDLIVQAKSGTGKTLIFCTVLLESYLAHVHKPQSLVVTPTREIAVQIVQILNKMGAECVGFQAVAAIGGLDVMSDRKRLQNARAVVGTPGRLLHLIDSGMLNVTGLALLVLDEADKLYNDGFRSDLQRIIGALPRKRQTICCSATFGNKQLDKQLSQCMHNPLLIAAEENATVLVGIKQFVYELPAYANSVQEIQAKLKALHYIFSTVACKQILVFAGSQSRAETYCTQLRREGWVCAYISAAQDQRSRLDIFQLFRDGKINILIATDLMSRGIDSSNLNLVVNLDMPNTLVTYLHRIGRAGRFGTYGIAVNVLASENDYAHYRRLMRQASHGMHVMRFPPQLATSSMAETRDFWDFGNMKADLEYYGVYDVSQATENLENSSSFVTDSQTQLDTKTFPVDDVPVGQYTQHPHESEYELEEDVDEEEEEIAHLPNSNTIDDASSIMADDSLPTEHTDRQQNEILRRRVLPALREYLIDSNDKTTLSNEDNDKCIDFFAEYRNYKMSLAN